MDSNKAEASSSSLECKHNGEYANILLMKSAGLSVDWKQANCLTSNSGLDRANTQDPITESVAVEFLT
jgi:hypothetical protein